MTYQTVDCRGHANYEPQNNERGEGPFDDRALIPCKTIEPLFLRNFAPPQLRHDEPVQPPPALRHLPQALAVTRIPAADRIERNTVGAQPHAFEDLAKDHRPARAAQHIGM